MKIVQEDRNLEEHVQQLFEASGAMFLLSTHLQAAQRQTQRVVIAIITRERKVPSGTKPEHLPGLRPDELQKEDHLQPQLPVEHWRNTRLDGFPFGMTKPTSSTTRTPKQTSTTGGSHRKSGNYDLDDDDQEGSPLVQDTPSPEFSSEESEDENQPLATAKRYKRRSTQKLPIIATSDEDEHDEEVEEQDEYRIEEDQEEHALFITQDKFLEYPTTGYEQDFQPPAKRNRTEPKLKIPPVTGQRAIKPRTAI
ncbi:hypothetical protein OS493_019946 [Desmophyllum pertusum]|uniref:Uncharacterized protein n=1 Tax=Desmophyllum pertusum TaxID=174260 RepID=A0A9X0CLL0_9CNID|nr:hypothetical protein OS493_019946 [Desmophyllum pertusum]